MRSRYKPSRPLFREISVEDFKATYDVIAADYSHQGDRNQVMAGTIVKHYLGGDWLERYIPAKSKWARYFRVDINASLREKSETMSRYWEFAETLLNLQTAEGFETILDELTHGKVESACGELDVARMIVFHDLKMKFVDPSKGPKHNYDFEVFYPDGFKICAEAAAKFESTTPRASSIGGSLRDSRHQLPDDEPSVILVKVPQNWIRDGELAKQIVAAAEDFLRQSKHVVSVKYYTPVTVFTPLATIRRHAYREILNPKFPERDWNMFRDETVPVGGMPSWWIRFYPELRIPNEVERSRRPI